MPKGYMYILACADGSYYTESTKDLEKRLEQHQNGEGANHTRKRLPVKLVYVEEFGRIDEAFYREKQVQGWSRKKKEALIDGMPEKLHELARCLNETTHVGFDSAQPTDPAQPTEQSERSLSGAETTDSAQPTEQSERSLSGAETKGNIPQLRFPDFSGEWELIKLGDICNRPSYGMNSAAKNYDGVNKYIRITDIEEHSREFRPNPLTSPDGDIEEKYILKEGDMVFARTGASVGKSYLYNADDGKLLYAGFLIKFSIRKAIPYFIQLQTFTEYYKKWVQVFSMRSGQPGLNAEEYSSLKLYFPSLPEQQKIADFLTAVDKRIRLLKEKKAALELYKKGVMQKIFPSSTSSNVPEIRFKIKNKDGALVEPTDWQEKRLGEVCEKKSSNVSANSLIGREGQYKIYGATGFLQKIDFYQEEKEYIAIVKDGAGVGRVFICEPKTSTLGTLDKLIERKGSNLAFVYYLLLQLKFSKYVTGSTIPHIYFRDYSKERITVPILQEQTKIADFLSSIDEKIENVAKALEATERYKKGLLQQLFV